MFKSSTVQKVLAAVGLAVGAVGGAQAAAYINTGNIRITLDYYDSGTVGYTRDCSGGLDCDAAANQVAGTTPGSAFITGLGYSDTQGIFQVNRITNLATNVDIYDSVFSGYILTGIFSGLVDIEVDVNGSVINTRAQGGALNIYQNALLQANGITQLAACGPAAGNLTAMNYSCGAGTITGGALFLSALFSESVIVDGSAPNATFQSTWDTAVSNSGSSSAFLDITGGTGAGIFGQDTLQDTLGNKHDLYFSNSFNLVARQTATNPSDWNILANTGEVIGNSPVPEPGTLALVALGLLGSGAVVRRRKAR